MSIQSNNGFCPIALDFILPMFYLTCQVFTLILHRSCRCSGETVFSLNLDWIMKKVSIYEYIMTVIHFTCHNFQYGVAVYCKTNMNISASWRMETNPDGDYISFNQTVVKIINFLYQILLAYTVEDAMHQTKSQWL